MFLQVREDPFMTGVSIVLLPVGALLYQLRKKQLKASGTDLDEEIKKKNVSNYKIRKEKFYGKQ